ncbi:hypothetical protein IFM89_021299 [Coptis chinensis]|uniref:Uncharacterized protein n=1 Tax=Coptis chinensis TaxID=261450 RepID=A0A835HX36_9MAGN|nr:hypothetical protein IFM89_021299 [Coptis chinensis]
MDSLLETYDDNGDDSPPPLHLLPSKTSAPKIDDTTYALANLSENKPIDPSQRVITYNPTYDQLWAPIYGPAHPYAKDGIAQGMRNHKLGFVENAAIEPFLFDEQYNTFHKYGYAADPSAMSGDNMVGDMEKMKENDGISVYNISQSEQKRRKIEKKKELKQGDESGDMDEDFDLEGVDNPATEEWLKKNRKSPWSGKKEGLVVELTEEQKKYAEEYAIKKAEKEKGGERDKGEAVVDKSMFHGKEENDYQGRSWIAAPKDAKAANEKCYIPKRKIHTWSGHTKGVSPLGSFLSMGIYCFLQNIKYWDTETGQVISKFFYWKIPYVVKLNPDDDKQNILLAGMSDKKIVQWDMNSKFVTSSDDKSLRMGIRIPVVIKYISEPHMHSMPAISLHPNSNWLAAQSLDNQILIYSTRDRFQLNKKKRFAGHIVAGVCLPNNFSPDGQYVMSGDGEGNCWYWNWKTCKVSRKLRCHDGVCIGSEKNVMSTTSVVTTGLAWREAAEATHEGLDAAGHAFGTAWAVLKICKALNPMAAMKPTSLVKSAAKAAELFFPREKISSGETLLPLIEAVPQKRLKDDKQQSSVISNSFVDMCAASVLPEIRERVTRKRPQHAGVAVWEQTRYLELLVYRYRVFFVHWVSQG